MALVRRLPVYAAGVGFTLAIVAVADAKKWSGLTITLVSLGVASFYVVTMLVPWLIREQSTNTRIATQPRIAAPVVVMRNGSSRAVFHVEIRLVDDLLDRLRQVAREAERTIVELAHVLVGAAPVRRSTRTPMPLPKATRPEPFHHFLDEDDLAIMAEDRRMDGDLGARGISEAWQA